MNIGTFIRVVLGNLTFYFLTVLHFSSIASAQTVLPRSCYAPIVPTCVSSISVFRENFSFQACRREIDQYRASVIAYDECLAAWLNNLLGEADQARDDAIYARERADTAIDIANQQQEFYYEAEAQAMIAQKDAIDRYIEISDYWNCQTADITVCTLP